MNEDEIVTLYRDARNKTAQLRILSELTLMDEAEIADILRDHGLKVPSVRARRRRDDEIKLYKWTEEADKKLCEMRANGVKWQAIAHALDCTVASASQHYCQLMRKKKNEVL